MTNQNNQDWKEKFKQLMNENVWHISKEGVQYQWQIPINFIEQTIHQETTKEIMLFKTEMQKRADTIPPNLLLNEIVNYAYDRTKEILQLTNNTNKELSNNK